MKTMEKELVLKIFKTAEKTAEASAAAGGVWCPEEERCVDALMRLKGVEIPREVVINSKMGKRLSLLKNHPRERIKELSSDVINAMKSALYRQHFAPTKTSSQSKKKEDDHRVPVVLALPALNSF